ncbi:outer membrane lipoprotein carrier protein LolA [bacterium]|nr:outer membrane lipoprotein carrier protein LolA [bacterium]
MSCIKLAALFFLISANLSAGEDAPSIIKKIQNKYKKTESFTFNFDYHFKWKLTGQHQDLQGKLYFKKENNIRYELGQQLNITNGEVVWQYSELNNQVLIDKLKKNSKSLFMPKYFLYDYLDKFIAEVIKIETVKDRLIYVLKLDPRDRDDFVQSMKIWVPADTWITEKIEYTDLEGNSISYEFTHVEIDRALDPKLFNFQVEQGMEVIDLR